MFGKKQGIFRQKALERISSPDNLDRLMRVVSPKDWLPLVVFGSLIALMLAWSVIGSVPTTVSARGVLIHPGRVLELQTLGAGRIDSLSVKTGDKIRQGQVIGHIDQFELRRRIENDRRQLAELLAQDRAQGTLQQDQVRLQSQQTGLERDFTRSQAESLRRNLSDAAQLDPVLKKRLEGLQRLRGEGLIPELSPELVQAEQAYLENAARITDATAKLKQLDVQIKTAENREASLANDNMESLALRTNQIREIEAGINLNQLQLDKNSDIVSEYTGEILEVLVSVGKIVTAGERVATLEGAGRDAALIAISYFPVRDGKKVQAGMPIQITPDIVERQRFGGIIGRVVSVSPLPVTREGAMATLGNKEVVEGLMPPGAYLEVKSELELDPSSISGYRWSSAGGPPVRITAGLTHTVRVMVESRAPITYVMPFLREATGIYK